MHIGYAATDMHIRHAYRICISDTHIGDSFWLCISDMQIGYAYRICIPDMHIGYAFPKYLSNMHKGVCCSALCLKLGQLYDCLLFDCVSTCASFRQTLCKCSNVGSFTCWMSCRREGNLLYVVQDMIRTWFQTLLTILTDCSNFERYTDVFESDLAI